MIEKLEDLELNKLDPKDENMLDMLNAILQEKLGTNLKDLSSPLITYIKEHAEELALQFPNIAPNGDYSKLLEDNDSMTSFLKSLSEDDFKISSIAEEKKLNVLKFSFYCTSIDDGDSLEGFTYLSKAGKIKHSFAQFCG